TIVRSSLNRTPTDVIKVVTMKEIERRLRYTGDSIKQISQAMNFPNTSFFGKYFKQHSGMTPNSYRKKYHK
nr:helix-turn-helix domain-containing protein [Prevotella sp.]